MPYKLLQIHTNKHMIPHPAVALRCDQQMINSLALGLHHRDTEFFYLSHLMPSAK
jgi:hypothetical protein